MSDLNFSSGFKQSLIGIDDKNKSKACPFCGSESGDGHKDTCYFRIGTTKSYNTRPIEDALRSELKEWKADAERLAKCLHPEVPMINTGIDYMVFELCEKFGYGAVMCSASRLWHEMNDSCKDGAFTVGSCYVIVENALEAHRALVEKEGKK